MSENEKDYKEQIADLLENYKDGRDVFIKNNWDEELPLKPGPRVDRPTTNWLALMEKVTGIIAKSKYGLETYPTEIDVVDSQEMLELYSTVALPEGYDYWARGKDQAQNEQRYRAGMMGLAFEIVINSNPSIAYCMATNSNAMMALVIAHAAQGHNAFFKNNELFKYHTNADDILGDSRRFKLFVAECEDKYGVDRVERVLDACHALQSYAVDHQIKPLTERTREEREKRKAAIERAWELSRDEVLEVTRLKSPGEDARPAVGSKRDDHPIDEQNILRYIANEFPHLESWERKIINMFCDQAQYFHPQILTKVMNEGLATYTHYKIMNDLHDLNLISDGMMLEFLASHTSVVFQPDFNDPRYSGINPYYLGFKMFMDIERMCTEPTEEDRKWFGEKKWFPAVGEKADYMAVIRDAAFNYKDETFIYQFLSPKLMRDMNLFVVRDDDQEPYMEVTAIPDDGYYKKLRADLAGQYDPARRVPDIRVHAYDEEGDRTLMLRHNMINRKPLDKATAEEVLKHIHGLLKHPVVLASFDEDGKIASNTLEGGALTCPSPLTVARPSPIYNFLHPPSPSP